VTTIEVNRVHYPVTALGPGTRAGIWVQGCTIGCAGCLAHDTWARKPDAAVPVADLLAWLAGLPERVDGVTISGGEPLEQPGAVGELLAGIHEWRGEREIDILLYTGMTYRKALSHRAEIVARCDAVVAGPYVARRNTGDTPLRGSGNQRLVPLTPLGHRRYAPGRPPGRSMQVATAGNRAWLIGIPGPGDLDELSRRLRDRGIRLEGESWRQ